MPGGQLAGSEPVGGEAVRLEMDGRLGVHRLADECPHAGAGDLEPVGREPGGEEVLPEG